MPTLQLERVSKKFKSHQVLQQISLEADAGETLVIFGPSGGGKTVLLRVIAGVYEPEEGRVVLQGHDMQDVAPEHRNVGMAFQNFALFPHLNAWENIASPLRATGAPNQEVNDKVLAIAQLLKIEHVLEHLPRALSNGQKQRTALARALVAAPKTVLLDDPLRNVDAKLRFEMRLELPRLLRRFGSTVLYVTQDYREAMALADRIAVLIEGKVEQFATPEEVYLRPASVDVAKLFGEPAINLVPTTVSAQADRVQLGNQPLRLPPGYQDWSQRSTLLGIRPEAIELLPEPQPEALPMEVLTITPLNERFVALLRVAGDVELLASYPAEEERASLGQQVWGRIQPEQVLLFDPDHHQRWIPQGN